MFDLHNCRGGSNSAAIVRLQPQFELIRELDTALSTISNPGETHTPVCSQLTPTQAVQPGHMPPANMEAQDQHGVCISAQAMQPPGYDQSIEFMDGVQGPEGILSRMEAREASKQKQNVDSEGSLSLEQVPATRQIIFENRKLNVHWENWMYTGPTPLCIVQMWEPIWKEMRKRELEMEQQQREIELEKEKQKREMQLEKEKQQREIELEKDKQQREIELEKEKQKREIEMDTELVQLMRELWELARNEVKEEMEIRHFSARMEIALGNTNNAQEILAGNGNARVEIAQLEKEIRQALNFLETGAHEQSRKKLSSDYEAFKKRVRILFGQSNRSRVRFTTLHSEMSGDDIQLYLSSIHV